MNKRLVEQYAVGDEIEIKFADGEWLRAVVVDLAHPGLWVKDDLGRFWYVTNTGRIRRLHDAT